MPFKINFSVVAFFAFGVLLALYAAALVWELCFAVDATWDKINFALLIFAAPLSLAFFALAGVVGYYSKKFIMFPTPTGAQVRKFVLLLVAGIVIWSAAIIFVPNYITGKLNAARTAETAAEIVSETDSYTSNSKGKGFTTYIVRYKYTVDGRSYENVSRFTTELKKGASRKTCYNPANPQSSQIRDSDYQCGQDSTE